MKTHHIGIIMNGVTGRMGTNQHLMRSIVAIRDGMLALRSLSRPGFASGAVPDWDALAPMRAPVSAAPFATPRSEPAATGSSM